MRTLKELELTPIQNTIVKEAKKSLETKRQAFVVAAPSLGKTYIAAKIISDSIRNKVNDKVLFISTSGSCTNTFAKFKDTEEFKNNVIMIELGELSRNEDYIKELNKIIPRKEVVKLIVIDEAHRLLAPLAFKALTKILDRFKDKKLLALTATPKRTDGKDTIKILTPSLVKDKDYTVRDVKYCLDNGLIKPFHYLGGYNVNFVKLEYQLVDELIKASKISKDYIDMAEKLKNQISEYSDNMYGCIVKDMQNKYNFELIDSQGERWFMFYTKVAEAIHSVGTIRNTFEQLYNKEEHPELKINIIMFTYNMSDKESREVIDKLNKKPEDNTIDIIVTVNKGSESLHPVNCRGVWMLRDTESNTIATQQSGRGFYASLESLKKMKNSDFGSTFIIDAVSNFDKFFNPTIYNGKNNLADRNRLDIDRLAKDLTSEFSKITGKLKKLSETYNEGFSTTLAGQAEGDFLNEIQALLNIVNDEEVIEQLIGIYSDRIVEDTKCTPISTFSSFDKEYGTNYLELYKRVRSNFVNEVYGRHNSNETTKLYNQLYNTFGNNLFNYSQNDYLDKNSTKYKDTVITFDLLERTAKKLAEYIVQEDGDVRKAYANHVSKTAELKKNICAIQSSAITNSLCIPYTKFCIKSNIDINGVYMDIISECSSYIDDVDMQKDFCNIAKEFSKVTDSEQAIKAMVKYYAFIARYGAGRSGSRLEEVNMCKHALKLKFNVMNKIDYLFTSEEQKNASLLADAIVRFTGGTNVELYKHGDKFQLAVIDLISRNDISTEQDDKLTELELGILQLMWKNVNNSRRTSNINKLVEILPFYGHYTDFVKNKSMSKEDYIAIVNVNKSCNEIRRLTNTKEYKESVTNYLENCNKQTEVVNKSVISKSVPINEIVKVDWTRRAARTTEQLFRTLLKEKEASNKIFIDNSLKNMNITKTNMLMQLIGSDNPSLENVDRINTILINGVQSQIDNILLNRLYNKLDYNKKRLIKLFDKLNYFEDNERLKSVIDNLVIR